MTKISKLAALAFVICSFNEAIASDLPDMVCQQIDSKVVASDASDLFDDMPNVTKTKTLHRIIDNRLFLSSPEREEYFYNDVTKQEYLRYVSGHKVIVFLDSEFQSAVVTQISNVVVTIERLHCLVTKLDSL